MTPFTLLTNLLKTLFLMLKCFIGYLTLSRVVITCKNTLLFISIFLEKHIAFLDIRKNVLDIHIKRYFYALYGKNFNNLEP